MRYIKLLPDIKLTHINGEPLTPEMSCSHKEFLMSRLADNEFADKVENIGIALDIRAKIRTSTEVLELENTEWEKMVKSASSPTGGYNPQLAHNFFEFIQSVLNAPNVR